MSMASMREPAPSVVKMRVSWFLTVPALTASFAATWLVELPSLSWRSIASSRSVSEPQRGEELVALLDPGFELVDQVRQLIGVDQRSVSVCLPNCVDQLAEARLLGRNPTAPAARARSTQGHRSPPG